MAKSEDHIPNFDNLDISDDKAAPSEPASAEPAEPEVVEIAAEPEVVETVEAEVVEPPAAAAPPAEEEAGLAPPADKKEEEQEEKEPEEKEPSKLPLYLPVAAAIGLPVIVLLGAFLFAGGTIGAISTAVYIIILGYIPLGLWIERKTNTVFVVILGCVLAALLTAVYCLWMELGRYKFDIKAQDAKQRVSVVWPGRSPGEKKGTVPICATFSLLQRADRLLGQRDRFIADRIAVTLGDGETGLLFLGALHRLDGLLPADIRLETLA